MQLPPAKLIVGNWKMNGLAQSAVELVSAIGQHQNRSCDVVICPPFTLLSGLSPLCRQYHIGLGGQDCHAEAEGAYTGDISPDMLKDAGCGYVILGHSERRTAYNESNALVQKKAENALKSGLTVIICIGESLKEYQEGKTLEVLETQLLESIPASAPAEKLVVAYEPVWAIGTGKTPTCEEIANAHHFIYKTAAKIFEKSFKVLYGGSAKPHNAAEILAIPYVDGLLVGGASLVSADFLAMIEAAAGRDENKGLSEMKR